MKKAIRWLDANLEQMILCILLAAMAVIMGVQVFCRYVLQMSLSWSEELTRYLFIWSGFLSVSYCSKYCISIKIEQFAAKLSRRPRAILKIINHTIELAFFIYMIPFAFSFFMSSFYNHQVSPAMGLPMYYVQAAPLVSFVLVAIRILQRWIIEFKVAMGWPVYDPAHPERNTTDAFIEAGSESLAEDLKDHDNAVLAEEMEEGKYSVSGDLEPMENGTSKSDPMKKEETE